MRILLDTNVVLDVLLKREPWVHDAAAIWQANDEGQVTGYLAGSVLTDIFYIARRLTDMETAYRAVNLCLTAFEICPIDRNTLEQALTLPGNDFEDNVQIAAAILGNLDAIITRNKDDFSGTAIPAFSLAEFHQKLKP